jgi:hypothetical protein
VYDGTQYVCAIVLDTDFYSATIAGIENIDRFDFWSLIQQKVSIGIIYIIRRDEVVL